VRTTAHRDGRGDSWNLCRFRGNVKMAVRSTSYRAFAAHLDRTTGFYFERLGDVPVRTLAAAMLLRPEELYRFEDLGYKCPPFWTCPRNAPDRQMPKSRLLEPPGGLSAGCEGAVGCWCECFEKDKVANFDGFCIRKFDEALRGKKKLLGGDAAGLNLNVTILYC